MSTQTSQRGTQASQHGSFTIERIYEASSSRLRGMGERRGQVALVRGA